MVADRNLKAETLVGYVDHQTIDQLVVDALRASGGSLIKDPYFRKLDPVCASAAQQVKALPQPATAAAVPCLPRRRAHASASSADGKAAAIKPPKKHATFHKQLHRLQRRHDRARRRRHERGEGQAGRRDESSRALAREAKRLDKKFVAKNGAHGLSCF